MQVYQIARKVAEEQLQYGGSSSRLSIPTVYDRIKRSNSSLNRKNKKILEDSIERVLEVIKDESVADDEEGSIDVDLDGLEDTRSTILVSSAELFIARIHS
jgi:ribosome biogenesis ATPase